jgi:hypothetical protein
MAARHAVMPTGLLANVMLCRFYYLALVSERKVVKARKECRALFRILPPQHFGEVAVHVTRSRMCNLPLVIPQILQPACLKQAPGLTLLMSHELTLV